jgi:hypothetical protein
MNRTGPPTGLRALYWFDDPRRCEHAADVVPGAMPLGLCVACSVAAATALPAVVGATGLAPQPAPCAEAPTETRICARGDEDSN